ncbi:amidohydrolase family protein [Robiginitalea sp. SC105]|uniref:amidohydrolase family protein n=1 Tax=Robiginitalea sp. SC105 TaxID=2762332 RepID=UPI001639D25C|nr:amidohydrolase family protein [Robiginitalea sp. SC105]MBC2838625.1 amidohydrolase [Robiginitalea sp. SC105]
MIRPYPIILFILLFAACQTKDNTKPEDKSSTGRYEGPIIDMHLHADFLEDYGGGGPICVNRGKVILPGWDPEKALTMDSVIRCDIQVPSSESNEALTTETLEMLDKHNVYAVTFGTPERVGEWHEKSPKRIIPALSFTSEKSARYTLSDYKKFHEAGKLQVFAENGAQYHGKTLNDKAYDSIWSLAEQLDIPVGVHLGEGPPGGAHLLGGSSPSAYRVSLGSPFQLDEVLIKYPKLRVYVMHFASPLVDEMIAMLYSHPQLYVDISQNNWGFPRAHFYSQLERLINAGFEERIMWGSDQMVWPETIEVAIETIQEAPFLDPSQKQKIFYTNACKFLRLSNEEIQSHKDYN